MLPTVRGPGRPRREVASWGLAWGLGLVACSGTITSEATGHHQDEPSPAAEAAAMDGLVERPDEALPSGEAAGGLEPEDPASEDPAPEPEGGSAAELPASETSPHEYCDAVTEVFQQVCGNGSCHSNPGATIGDFAVSFERASAYVDRPSARDPSCGAIIDSERPGRSLLLLKMVGAQPYGCGAIMPVGSFGEVTPQQVQCVADWVSQFQAR